jgi:DNA-binding NarL/FixJ family response regulator
MKLLMVEDQALFRSGLKRYLEAELKDCQITEASTAQDALAALSRERQDLMLTDLSLPLYDGLWLIQRLREDGCELPILVLTLHDRPQTVGRALTLGANGYLLKSTEPDQFLIAVESLLAGGSYVDARLRPQDDAKLPKLSLTSIELLNHLRAGLEPERIREELKASQPTYQSMTRSLCRKLQIDDLNGAVKQALKLGLLVSENHGD